MSIPERIDEILTEWGIFVPEEFKQQIETGEVSGMGEMYQWAMTGRCMTCGGDLGEDTMAVIAPPFMDGEDKEAQVLMLFCGGLCLRDMQVIGWIQQQHKDIEHAVEFRGMKRGG